MDIFARIENGRVVEIVRHDPTGLYADDLLWVPVPSALHDWLSYRYIVTSDGVSPPSVAAFQQQLLAALAARRWQEETKGALVSGRRYHTDQASQAKLTAALLMGRLLEEANGEGTYQLTWKAMDGWVDLDLAALTTVALTCGAHVQTAYSREAAIASLIDAAADWQAALQVYEANINTGWPD